MPTGIMAASIITVEDLNAFKLELLEAIDKKLSQRQPPPPAQRWFKSYQLKKHLPLSKGIIQKLRDSGKLPYSKFGRAIIYDYYDIEKVVAEHKLIPQASAPENSKEKI